MLRWRSAINVRGRLLVNHRCKKRFLRFLFWSRFLTFLKTFFNFPNVFFIFKNVDKVQSGMQINKKHFQNDSNEIDL